MNKHTIVHAVLAFSLAVSLILQPAKTITVYAEGAVRRVVPGGSADPACGGGWDPASPNPALRPCDLQTALDTSAMLDEIWVAEGVYIPSKPTDPADPRTATFELPVGGTNYDGLALYGGFAGTETTLQQRDWKRHITVLSGDLDRNDLHRPAVAVTDIQGANAYHVVKISTVSDTAVLDGFTISGGAADDGMSTFADRGQGGGIYNNGGRPTLRNLVFQGSTADMGGGVFNVDGHPTLTNILFRGNTAMLGGGMYNAGAAPALTNVTFYGNSASERGGALSNAGVDMESNPLFPLLTNVTLVANSAGGYGGAIENVSSHLVFANSILWGNTPDQIYNNVEYNPNVSLTLRDSLIENDCPEYTTCEDVIHDNPDLGPLTGPGNFQFLPLKPASPAVDKVPAEHCTRVNPLTHETAPLTFDQRGAPRPAGAACDLGAHEYQAALAVISGDNQRTDAFTPFPDPLVVGASSSWGDQVEGLVVHFTPFVSDPGGRISSSTAVISGGQASVTATAQAASGFSVEATAPGFNTVWFHLSVNDTKVTLTASPNPAAFGQSVTLTARVDSKLFGFPPPPTGSVTFKDGITPIGTFTLPPAGPIGTDGPFALAVLTVSNLSTGAHALTAVYSGGGIYHDITTSAALNVTIFGAGAPVDLGGLEQTYTGAPRTVSVSTTPPNLAVRVTYNGSIEQPVKAGSYAVYAEVTDPNYTGSAAGTLVISKAVLNFRADNLSRKYRKPNPPLTYTISGYVNGEGESAISGTPVLGPLPALTAPPGHYPIDIQMGSLTAMNYTFNLVPGELIITKAATHVSLETAPTPARAGQPVTLTAAVSSDTGPLPDGIHFGGSAVFTIAGGPPVVVPLDSNGTAEYQLDAPPPGAYDVAVEYRGDTNFSGSSAGPLQMLMDWLRLFLPLVMP